MDTLYRLDRAIIEIGGAGARAFLQNLLTQDLDGLEVEGIQYAALLSPQGKVQADMFLWPYGQDILADVDASRADTVLRRLSMYNLRGVVGIHQTDQLGSIAWSSAPFANAHRDPRLPALGWRGFVNPGVNPPDGAKAYEAHRIELGVPDLARDAQPDEVFAGEALLEELNGVAFDKGCFVGQENVSRMKRRATTRKKFCPIAFEGEAPAFGTPVLAGGAEIGTVRSGAPGRALALLRLDRALEAQAAGKTLTAADRPVSLAPPPWLILPQREDNPS